MYVTKKNTDLTNNMTGDNEYISKNDKNVETASVTPMGTPLFFTG